MQVFLLLLLLPFITVLIVDIAKIMSQFGRYT
jgi:hypothetical protein